MATQKDLIQAREEQIQARIAVVRSEIDYLVRCLEEAQEGPEGFDPDTGERLIYHPAYDYPLSDAQSELYHLERLLGVAA